MRIELHSYGTAEMNVKIREDETHTNNHSFLTAA
jgi:hypothetical protein